MFQHYPPGGPHVGPQTTQTLFSSTNDYMQQQQSMQQYQQANPEALEVEAILSGGVRGGGGVPGVPKPRPNSFAPSPAAVNPHLRQKKLASPAMAEMMRNSPTYRNSPRLDMELMDLAHLPPAPAPKMTQRPPSSSYQSQVTSYQPQTAYPYTSQFSSGQPGSDRNM